MRADLGRVLAIGLAVGVASSGCGSTDPGEALPVTAAIVGTISDPTGTPIAGAAVSVTAQQSTCGVGTPFTAQGSSDVAGHFRLRVLAQIEGLYCVTVAARRSGASDSATTSGSVRLKANSSLATEDSLVVALTVR